MSTMKGQEDACICGNCVMAGGSWKQKMCLPESPPGQHKTRSLDDHPQWALHTLREALELQREMDSLTMNV